MSSSIPLFPTSPLTDFELYEKRFKALADQKRLQLLAILCKDGSTCVCDLTETLNLPQSKLSYHIKILLDADLIMKEKQGTWNYYKVNTNVLNEMLSEELCSLFNPANL